MSAPVRILRDAPLAGRNSFGVAATAPLLAEVDDPAALPQLLSRPEFARPMVLGGGSNLLLAGDPDRPLLALTGQRVEVLGEDGPVTMVRAQAGANWHRFVLHSLDLGLCGLENLALIPGTVGAAPIQNIGAYGVEAGEFVHAVHAWEPARGRWHRLDRAACAFGYRDSLFKHEPDRLVITAVDFALPRQAAPRLGYAGLGEALAAAGIGHPTALDVARAVIGIRQRKLPDPAVLGNAGSFFKNPVIPAARAQALLDAHPGLPCFGSGTARKLSAAWLIDACGWKGHRDGDAGVSPDHALVLVNRGGASGAQLLALARRIADSVRARFGVDLEPEPRLVGARW
ncbi:UDP-N-acetylmuramate dehydrogenase [Lysobacter sp. GX 14042]|uniref:UDP-N-acetylmuramate dehydrogenase n=1 Tax=Lysobacter sp. GX 14042 TaxID=2907155 RepID=UPI001F17DC89|nr:UDP-N-acetylmuramate dehydrogenase [Lysobacter sp. GX 14042]MCE7032628.1 UDP-N-acetylmuramate dehydrogenase [Lysobacter sp. GX 14042]